MLLGIGFNLPDISDILLIIKQIFFSIDTIIYNAIGWMYTVFISIAGSKIFTSSLINDFLNRIYIIISIVMLFIVAYSFLTIIINPDNLSKGNTAPSKFVINTIIALVTIVMVPSAFSYAFSFQKAVIQENVIGKLVLGTDQKVDLNTFDRKAADFSISLFEANYYLKDENDSLKTSFESARNTSRNENDISYLGTFLVKNEHEKIQYNFFLTTVIGAFVLYTLVTFCFDVGLRVVKLLFYELIAPVPALLMLVPGQDKVLKSWGKEVLKTFLDVFIKIAIIMFGVFLIGVLGDQISNGTIAGFESTDRSVILFAKIFIYLGIIMFMRQAPKLIEDLFGIKLDSGTFSLRKRLNDSGLTSIFGAGAGAVAGAISSYKGAQARNGKKWVAAAGGAFHGIRLGGKSGWKGSLNGIGDAYNYGWANQQAWSHMDASKGYLANQIAVAGEMLRDNFGLQSYYDDLKDEARIKHDVITAKNNREIQAIDKQYNEKVEELDKQHQFDARINANQKFLDAAKKAGDTAKDEVYKDGYKGTTKAWIPVFNGTNYEIKEQDVSASQFARIRETLSEAVTSGQLIDQEQSILEQLDAAEKRVKNDYDTNTLLSEKRDNGSLTTATRRSYIDSYIENMKSQKQWNGTSFVEYDSLSAAQQATLEGRWRTAAAAKYSDITVNHPGDYKTNLSHAAELHQVLDLAAISKKQADARGFIKDAAGLKYDSAHNTFISNAAIDALSDANGNTDHIISATDIQAAIKAVKTQDVSGERSMEYRNTTIDVNGVSTRMTDALLSRESLIEENKRADKDLEDKMLSLKTDEQTAEAARKIGKFRAHGGGDNGGKK